MQNAKLLSALFAVALLGVSCGQKDGAPVVNQPQGEETAAQESPTPEAPVQNLVVTLKTSMGDIAIALDSARAPITAGNFLKLAKEDFYDNVAFHRVIPDFMIQGGDPLSKDDDPANDGTGGPGYFIEDEFSPELSNVRGTISMANAGPGTAGSQFFINLSDNTFLDFDKEPLSSKHAVFGRVTEGMDTVDAISKVARDNRDRPNEPVVITDVVVE
ncbi:MAG: peptidylprolyl isomerase [Parcubacteria group bacterium]|nr:peptidylprolyl isomerase [Parcubacteria group bacterium]